jgi:D-alanine transaminase/branched-chain amino acid aminotransferase
MTLSFSLINGDFFPADQAVLHIGDLALQRGYGVFDFFRTVRGRPVFLDDHLDRFHHSASRMRLELTSNRDEFKSLLSELLQKNNMPDSGVRITLTGGYSPDGYAIAKPNLIITQRPLTANKELAARGVRLITYPHLRQFSDVKTIDYLMAVWLQPHLREQGADDVLYHHDGAVCECPRSNIFIVTSDEKLITPGDQILKGVVRKQVLRLAASRFSAEEGTVSLQQLRTAKEVFMTSTTRGVMPVVQVDGHPVGTGQPGAITRLLMDEFDAHRSAAI